MLRGRYVIDLFYGFVRARKNRYFSRGERLGTVQPDRGPDVPLEAANVAQEIIVKPSLTNPRAFRWKALIGGILLLGSMACRAHHSFAMFDQKRHITLSGTVADYQFTNPHSYIYLNVLQSNGTTKQYTLECPAPALLKRLGWNRSTLKAGDKVTVVIDPLRDGSPGGQLRQVTLPGGKVLAALADQVSLDNSLGK